METRVTYSLGSDSEYLGDMVPGDYAVATSNCSARPVQGHILYCHKADVNSGKIVIVSLTNPDWVYDSNDPDGPTIRKMKPGESFKVVVTGVPE